MCVSVVDRTVKSDENMSGKRPLLLIEFMFPANAQELNRIIKEDLTPAKPMAVSLFFDW